MLQLEETIVGTLSGIDNKYLNNSGIYVSLNAIKNFDNAEIIGYLIQIKNVATNESNFLQTKFAVEASGYYRNVLTDDDYLLI